MILAPASGTRLVLLRPGRYSGKGDFLTCKLHKVLPMKLLLGFLAISLTAVSAFSQPAWSKPATTASPAASPSAAPSGTATVNPIWQGVNLTATQKTRIVAIYNRSDTQVVALLTPAQKTALQTSGSSAVQLTAAQKTQYQQILTQLDADITAVLTPAQIKQVRSNVQSIQQQRQRSGATTGQRR
jgi:Spy/CpxP family protein refolding chaperone